MGNQWKNLQPLRVANGWTIDINNLYRFDLTEENLDWYYGEFLLCGTHTQKKVCFDSSFEPEGDPQGFLVVKFFSMQTDPATLQSECDRLLGEFKTRDKARFIEVVETFMFTNQLPLD